MLQFLTDYQLKSLLNVMPFRPAGSDVQSLFNSPDDVITSGKSSFRCLDYGKFTRRMTAYDIFKIDQYKEYMGSWSFLWTNETAMRETGWRELACCIEVDFHLLTALDFCDFHKGKGTLEHDLMIKNYPDGWRCIHE